MLERVLMAVDRWRLVGPRGRLQICNSGSNRRLSQVLATLC